MRPRIPFFCFIFLLAITIGCQPSPKKVKKTARGFEVADTIIYPVDVMNLDSADEWTDTRLKNLRHQELTDLFFEAVYDGNATAVDYYSREPISTEELKEMEASGEIEREEMAQLQFEEAWYFNPDEGHMTKNVQSVLLAWPVYDNKGEFQAFKAGFVIELN
ncbi:MAG: hypothetical protein ACOC10_09085 [Bacteroidota bacterium]